MDIQALMQAAQGGDPQAAQFIQQLLSGGTPMSQRMPEIKRQELMLPEFAPESPNAGAGTGLGELAGSLPVFDPVRARLGEMGDWAAQKLGGGGFQPQPVPPMEGMPPPTSLGGGAAPPDPGMLGQMEGPAPLPPGGEVTQTTLPPPQMGGGMTDEDLIAMLQGALG